MKRKLVTLLLSLFAAASVGTIVACDKNPQGESSSKSSSSSSVTLLENTKTPTEGLEYTLSMDGTYYVAAGMGTATDTEIVISVSYNGLPVKEVRDYAFQQKNITSVFIPDSVEKIGISAFGFCYQLKMATLGKNVKELSSLAFETCSALESVNIPEGITEIGVETFVDCRSLKSVTLPTNLTKIGEEAFAYCESLESISIPGGVQAIGPSAFLGCDSLTSVTIANGVKEIGERAFMSCYALKSVTLPNTLETIGESAFESCYALLNIQLPDSLKNIGANAFWACESLTSVVIPNGVTELGANTFRYCDRLLSVVVGNGVKSIGSEAFRDCGSLTSVRLGANVEKIEGKAFAFCKNLMSITLPETLTEIGYEAFEDCYKLIEVVNKSSLQIVAGQESNGGVASYAKGVVTSQEESKIREQDGFIFYEGEDKCYLVGYLYSRPSTLVLPERMNTNDILPGVVSGEKYHIYVHAFDGWSDLLSVTLGSGTLSIGENAFRDCYKLVEVVNKSELAITKGSGVAEYAKEVITQAPFASKLITQGDYVFSIANGRYELAGYIGKQTDLVLPETVNGNSYSIGCNAFRGADITSVIIPDGVTAIDNAAFERCNRLQYVRVGSGVKTIKEDAFAQSYNLTLILEKGVTTIEDGAFDVCENLKIYYTGTQSEYAAIANGTGYKENTSAVYYYSESQPASEGRYWHYGADNKMPVVWEQQ